MHRKISSKITLRLLVILAFFGTVRADTNETTSTEDPYQIDVVPIPKSCVNKNATEAAIKLDFICEYCANHTNNPDVKDLCSNACYSTEYVPACVKVLCYWEEKDDYRRWVEDLSGNKFAVWESQEVRLLDKISEVPETPVVLHHSIERRSTDDYCKTK